MKPWERARGPALALRCPSAPAGLLRWAEQPQGLLTAPAAPCWGLPKRHRALLSPPTPPQEPAQAPNTIHHLIWSLFYFCRVLGQVKQAQVYFRRGYNDDLWGGISLFPVCLSWSLCILMLYSSPPPRKFPLHMHCAVSTVLLLTGKGFGLPQEIFQKRFSRHRTPQSLSRDT